MDTIIDAVSENLGYEPSQVNAIIEETMLQLHRRIYEYVGMNGSYIGEELHYQISDQAYYHLLGFLDLFSDKYEWEMGDANEYLLRLSPRSTWAPFKHQTEAWVSGEKTVK